MASWRFQERKKNTRRAVMNHGLWDRVRGLGSETWKGCDLIKLLVFLHVLEK